MKSWIINKDRPGIVSIIGDITFLEAIFLSVTTILGIIKLLGTDNGAVMAFSQIALVVLLEIVNIAASVVLLVAAIGYLKLEKWGYWLMVIMNGLALIAAVIAMLQNGLDVSYLVVLQPVISLAFILPTRKYFWEQELEQNED